MNYIFLIKFFNFLIKFYIKIGYFYPIYTLKSIINNLLKNVIWSKIFYCRYYMQIREYEKAEECIQTYLSIYKKDYKGIFLNAVIKQELEKIDECKSCIKTLDYVKFDDPLFYILKAEFYFYLKNKIKTKYYIKKIIILLNKNSFLCIGLTSLLIKLDEFDQAEIFCKKYKNDRRYYKIMTLYLIEINIIKGNLSLAKEIAIDLFKKFPDFHQAFLKYTDLSLHKEFPEIRKKILMKKEINRFSSIDNIELYFAKFKIYDGELNFKKSQYFLKKANDLKLKYYPSNIDFLIKQAIFLFVEFQSINWKIEKKAKGETKYIFIVGMPRSGSTLLENILLTNKKIFSIGESTIFEDKLMKWFKKDISSKFKYETTRKLILLDKNLFNFKYVGYICKLLPNAKVIHCVRNPLDNLYSIYKANLNLNFFSSSLIDSAKFLLLQKNLMNSYKKNFKDSIYTLKYENLINNSESCLIDLINWLNLEWNSDYLKHEKQKRFVKTASYIQVRSPINKKSINKWINYKDLLEPAKKLLERDFKDLTKDENIRL